MERKIRDIHKSIKKYESELKTHEKELRDAKKNLTDIKARTSISPIAVMLHKDEYVTEYRDYVSELDISSNPYASPSKKLSESVEYLILNRFDSDLAVAVLRDPSLKVTDDDTTEDKQLVRRFVAENAEFLSRYCYHECYCGTYDIEYKYPDRSLLKA